MTTTPTTTEELLDYWPGNIPFKGKLVSDDGTCMCAQGQALHFIDGLTVDELRNVEQSEADSRVARIFGISTAHSVLLRMINDGRQGAPTCVIRDPEQVIGDQAQTVLKFWRHLDRMTPSEWGKVLAARPAAWEAARSAARPAAWEAARSAAWEAARSAAWKAAWEAAWSAAWEAARSAAWKAAWEAAWEAAWATNEIQGAAVMRANNQPFYFLPMFGFNTPEEIK